MRSVWGRMRVPVCMLIVSVAACALADEIQDRRSKLPFIADAVGNSLPPPSNVPATVGSPVNLLTPDRYEFYTFDESGELVKRLMTLEEIQAIVAAGEETEGLVTFANDNQPTIAFNFSQPSHTKVHSVVTNVQNVLKAQMEAHKNKPPTQPPLDTPDVSDSWSLILPSIFGNTGVDIVPDKTSDSFITPETETIELDTTNFEDENSLGKEGTNPIPGSTADEKLSPAKTTLSTSTTTVPPTTVTTTTAKTTTTSKMPVPSTTKPIRTTTMTTTTTTTTAKPKTTTPTTTTTTSTITTKPPTTTITSTRNKPVTTSRPRPTPAVHRRTTVTSTTAVPLTSRTEKPTPSRRPFTTTKPTTQKTNSEDKNQISINTGNSNPKNPVQYEKVSTIDPSSVVSYITERPTRRPLITTRVTTPLTSITTTTVTSTTPQSTTKKIQASTNPYATSINDQEYDKINSTTITTQSVSPSTTVSSTEFIIFNNSPDDTNKKNQEITQNDNNVNDVKEKEQIIPMFDVAQSISQIASDLGGNYAPMPTSSNLLDTTKISNMDLESKENLEIDIPAESENEQKKSNNSITDNFIKISTLDPHNKNGNKTLSKPVMQESITNKVSDKIQSSLATTTTSTAPPTSPSTTIDPILSESMEDLLSQVVNSAPESIISPNKKADELLKENTKPEVINNNDNIQTIKEETTTEIIITDEKPVVQSSVPAQNDVLTSSVNQSTKNTLAVNDTNEIETLQKDKTEENIKNELNTVEHKTEHFVQVPVVDNKNGNKSTSNVDVSKNNLSKAENTVKTEIYNEKVPDVKIIEIKNLTDSDIPKDVKEDTVITTESLPRLESTTTKSGSTTRQQGSDDMISNDKIAPIKNRFAIKNQKDKDAVVFPKIDEFKKKIQKVNIDDKELANERNSSWKLIPAVSPPKANELGKDKHKTDSFIPELHEDKNIILDFSKENQGLEVTTKDLGEDIAQFTELCNELAFQYWSDIIKDIDKKRSFVLSPYSITSMLAMMFMGARGSTSGEMNEILKLDDMVTFNPHFTLKNISDSIETSPGSGVAISAFIRELYSDKGKGKILTFYKERAQHFYNGHVEEVNYKLISDIIRRRTNLLVKRYTWGKIMEYMKTNTIILHPPLAAYSVNIFETDCSSSSVDGRDGEMYFVVSPNVRQRRLVPVPAVVYRSNFLAGYDPVLDATAAALGNTNSVISTLFLMPGQQGNVVHAEDLEALEKRLLDSSPTTPAWNRLLRTLLPRVGLELQIPRFSHKSIFNISSTLRRMGLKDLFDQDHADLGGLNGPSKDLYLSDMIQTTTFVTCGEGVISEQHHIEQYPETLDLGQKRRTARWVTGWDEPRDYQRAFHDPHDVGDAMHLPLHLRPRQARLPARNAQPARLKFDRPFLFFVRHNPSGMILYVGRYNPRLLP